MATSEAFAFQREKSKLVSSTSLILQTFILAKNPITCYNPKNALVHSHPPSCGFPTTINQLNQKRKKNILKSKYVKGRL